MDKEAIQFNVNILQGMIKFAETTTNNLKLLINDIKKDIEVLNFLMEQQEPE